MVPLSAAGVVTPVTAESTLTVTPPVVARFAVPAVPPLLCELRDCRFGLTVIVPLEPTVRTQTEATVPLKITPCVAANVTEEDAASPRNASPGKIPFMRRALSLLNKETLKHKYS